ncbi:Phosphate transport system permease protein pstA [Acholeplasma oculi]|uniref:Phosphate transport system permease protein PstA n=1 Tax=Acholeplasma oculi TaxID=35623 RepID=A0A061A9V4_9MOLU|nr:phosphate ABC transporter permease PstA [Acholeplasma oculi]CDR30174.1 Phosphate transport system permease protein PstA [Acholeplasma oculi]SKC44240.1 phosphate ABC transporter membrane protein 2, PhoT family [Acholeplasma oculi]SUT88515.1 Phosphate transport system permease protein pstA [Acholeplasma oculi]
MLSKKGFHFKDFIRTLLTYGGAFISFSVLMIIVVNILIQGIPLLNLDLIMNNYESVSYVTEVKSGLTPGSYVLDQTLGNDVYYSEKWGIGFRDDKDLLGKNVIYIDYIHEDSPLRTMINKGVGPSEINLSEKYVVVRIAFHGLPSALSIHGSENMVTLLEQADTIREFEFQTPGGGIRGSIITTLILIGLTLVIALPIGIGASIYLNEYAKNNWIQKQLRSFIETLTGVPSIIYGLMGLALFVPMTISLTGATGGNLISGALTLAVIVLPVIIRTTEESLKVVPMDYRNASLALGANETQTTFKVVLPNAFPGILTATLLAIGRIIGESAALVFAIGTAIKDEVHLTDKSTSLAVHIWTMMTDEPANIELSNTIALIILGIVLILNLTVKFISKRFIKRYGVKH